MKSRSGGDAGSGVPKDATYVPLSHLEDLVGGALISAIAMGAVAVPADLAGYALVERASGRGFLTDSQATAHDRIETGEWHEGPHHAVREMTEERLVIIATG